MPADRDFEAARDRQAMDLLDKWPWNDGGTLIGSYAIAAYGSPRYSQDLDIVIPRPSLPHVKEFLALEGFWIEKTFPPTVPYESEDALRYAKEGVKIDVMVGHVRDRVAGVDIPESWISSGRIRLKLKTMTGTTAKALPVARPEVIWALKLQAARDQDITDLFGMFRANVDKEEVIDLFRGFMTEGVAKKLQEAAEKATSTKLFEDSMSKMRTKRSEENQKRWLSFGVAVNHIARESVRTPS